MRIVLLAAGTAASVVLLAGCGGGGGAANLVPGQSDAAAACQAQGVHAAGLATDAAAQNPIYAALAADEGALAATLANQESELSDGSSADDNGLGSLSSGETAGSSADVKVVSDCVALGLPVPH
jgi:hypothetical protein